MEVFEHDPGCEWARPATGGHSDAARRVRDTYSMHQEAGKAYGTLVHLNKIFAVALSDGTGDGSLYDTRHEAIRHQHHNEKWYAYLRVERHPMSLCNAESILKMHRDAYDAGLNFADRDDAFVSAHEIIPRLTAEDHSKQVRNLARFS